MSTYRPLSLATYVAQMRCNYTLATIVQRSSCDLKSSSSRGEVAILCCTERAGLDTSVTNNARRHTQQRHRTTIHRPSQVINILNTFL